MILKEHQSREQGLSDLLNYAFFVEEGIILNKDGAFLMTYQFRGPDMYSASPAELDALCANFSRMVTFLEDGWMLHVDELRIPSLDYPAQGAFADTVSTLIDEERRMLYESSGHHFENLQFLTFVWKFPMPMVKTLKHWFVEGVPDTAKCEDLASLLLSFKTMIERCVGLLATHFTMERLSSQDLLSYLNTCISGEILPVALPPSDCPIDTVLGRRPLVGGYHPRVGQKHLRVLSIVGYLNEATLPGLLDEMGTYPLVYRWSNRFIPLSESTAAREIKRYRRNWHNKVKGFTGILREVITGSTTEKINHDALDMQNETEIAATLNSNQSVRFGYWTSELVILHEDVAMIEETIAHLSRYLEQSGFALINEEVNALDAWLGTIPGHGSCNVRRLLIHSLTLAQLLPLHTIWAGQATASPSSLLPKNAPPVFYASTIEHIPFRFQLDVEDVGHQVILGPTGSGKSTYLGFLIAQFLRYEGAQIFVFDKDSSHRALTLALSGNHYAIGHDNATNFCPLADITTTAKKIRAQQWLEEMVRLQNVTLTPEAREAIHLALVSFAQSDAGMDQSLTAFTHMVQHEAVRKALKFYTLEGPFKLMDAQVDSLRNVQLQTFEMGWLLTQRPEIYLPVLLYLFDHIETTLEENQSQKPTMIVLEEAWLYINHPVFASKLRDWLKTLRKKNARVIFATQSLSDLYDPSTQTLTQATAAIMESCPTKVYLPNPSMEAQMRELYCKMGLSPRQLEIIESIAQPKRHYYVVTPEGNRLTDLNFKSQESLALAFIGLSKEKSIALETCISQGADWIYHWLKQLGLEEWATYYKKYLEKGRVAA